MTPCLSPNGVNAYSLADPPLSLMVGTSSGVVQLERARPGAPWHIARTGLGGKHIGALASEPGGLLFAGCHKLGGIHRSADDGLTWTDITNGVAGTDVFSLLSLAGDKGFALFAGTEPVNLYRSDDFGESWRELPAVRCQPGAETWTFPPPPHIPHVKSMTADPLCCDSFFACIEQGAVLRTTDAGSTWEQISSVWRPSDPIYHDAHRLVVAPWNNNILFLTTGMGLYRSVDGGVSWTRHSELSEDLNYPDGMVASPHDDRMLFVTGARDNPLTWLRHGGSHSTVYRSRDEGTTWEPSQIGLPQASVCNNEAMAIADYPGGYTLFVGTTAGDVYASENQAESWTRIATGLAPVSKGGHHLLAHAASRLPRWVRPAAYSAMVRLTRYSAQRAAAKRRREFADFREH